MNSMELISQKLAEWATEKDVDCPAFDEVGNATVVYDNLQVIVSVRADNVFISANVTTIDDDTDRLELFATLLETHFLWHEANGFTFALAPDGQTLAIQDRRIVRWFEAVDMEAYLARLAETAAEVRDLVSFYGKEA